MSALTEHEIRHNGRLYGRIWSIHPDRWDAEKIGEFDTTRSGFPRRETAAAWVLTNPYPIHARRTL